MIDEKGQTQTAAPPRRRTAAEPATLTAMLFGKLGAEPDDAEAIASELRSLARKALRHPLSAAGDVLREANLLVREALEKRGGG